MDHEKLEAADEMLERLCCPDPNERLRDEIMAAILSDSKASTIASAILPIIVREVAAETERCVRVADAAKYTDAEVGIDHELQVWNACAEAIVMAIGGRAINAAMDAE